MDKSDIALDLDALSPAKVQISFKGKVIEVTPPTIEQFARILEYGTEMENLPDKSPVAVSEVYAKIRDFLQELIPDLQGVGLNYKQIIAVFQLLAGMANPNDDASVAELKKRGITIPSETDKTPKDSASPQQ